MKHSRFALFLLLFALLVSACAPQAVTVVPPSSGSAATPEPSVTPQPQEPTATPLSPEAQRAAAELLKALGLQGQVELVSVEKVDWTDSCLGLGGPAESCLQAITPGYKMVMTVAGKTYEVRTNEDASVVRFTESGTGQGGEPGRTFPPSVMGAIAELAKLIGVDPSEIHVVTFEAVQWPDACLGVQIPGQMCAEVITNGFKVILEVGIDNPQQFELHTNEDGSVVRLAFAPLALTQNKDLVWQQTVNGECVRLEVGAEGAAYGPCAGPLTEVKFLTPDRADQYKTLLGAYAPFSGATRAGLIHLNGSGTAEATPAEMRSVAEWARLIYAEASTGSAAKDGIAFTYEREGGIAGFCDTLTVYYSGFALPASCKSGTLVGLRRLSAAEIEQLFRYGDQFKSFEYEQSDGAVADSMKVRLVFTGSGPADAASGDMEAIAAYAADILANHP